MEQEKLTLHRTSRLKIKMKNKGRKKFYEKKVLNKHKIEQKFNNLSVRFVREEHMFTSKNIHCAFQISLNVFSDGH